MGDVVQISTTQNDTVYCFRHALDRALAGDVQVALIISLDKDGGVSYSRAGKLTCAGEILSLVGALEHHKTALMEHLMAFDEAAAAKAAAEEKDEPPDSS